MFLFNLNDIDVVVRILYYEFRLALYSLSFIFFKTECSELVRNKYIM